MKNPFVAFAPLVGGALVALLGAPGAAFAQTPAVTNAPTYLYAGPAPDYPVVAQLPGNVPVTVMGCVAGYSWCDVAMPGMRGWMYAGNILYPYQGNPVPLLSYGATLGLPIVSFSIGNYWNNYYRDRPWYGNRGRWERHAPPRPIGPPAMSGRPPAYGGGNYGGGNYGGNHGGNYGGNAGGNYGGGNRPQDFRPGPPPGGRPQAPGYDGRRPPPPRQDARGPGGEAPRYAPGPANNANNAGARPQRPEQRAEQRPAASNQERSGERSTGNAGGRMQAPPGSIAH